MRKLLLIALFFGVSLTLFGQTDEKDSSSIIKLNVIATRQVEPASRITSNPKLIDTIITHKAIEYPLLAMKHETSIKLEPIVPANVKVSADNKLPKLYNGYIKAGISSPLMPIAELYYNNTRSRKYVYGLNIKHLSSFGEIKKYAPAHFDKTSYNAFGGIKELTYSVMGNVQFDNYGVNRYGVLNPNANTDSTSQRFKELGGSVTFMSNRMDSLRLNYSMQIKGYHLSDAHPKDENFSSFYGNESNFASINNFWYRKNNNLFAADINLISNHFNYGTDGKMNVLDSAKDISNTIFSIKPSITTYAKANRLKVQVGMDISASLSSSKKVYIFPNVDVKYAMFENVLIPYIGIKGALKQNNFKTLTSQNAFIQSNPSLSNESNYTGFVGIKGILTKRMEFNVSASFAQVANKALFINDSATIHRNRNQFKVIYDTMTIFTAEAAVSYQLNEKLKLDGIGRFFNYQANNNPYAWNLPIYQFIVRGNYVLNNHFSFHLDLHGEGGRKAQVFDSTLANVTIEDKKYIKNLGLIVDGNIGAEYRYTDRISAFLQINNLAAQQYFRWYNYPVQALQIMGGVTVRF
jgi:hypothetical protein